MSAVPYQFKKDFNEYDPAKKDAEWANRLIKEFRLFMEPLVDNSRAAINRSYLMGEQSMDKHKKKFEDWAKMPFTFAPLGIMEKIRNILTAEREKAGLYLQINAYDPTAQEEKDMDKKLLINSSFIESLMTYAQNALGLPAYSLSEDKDVDGGKIPKGNLESFKDLGLNPNSQEDIAYFFKTHYRLDTEIAGEAAVNHFATVAELQEYIKYWMDDVMAVKAIAGRAFANELTYLPDYQYLRPENVRWIKGQRRDGKDAKAIMSLQDMTVSEFLAKIGSELTAGNVQDMIDSVNYHNSLLSTNVKGYRPYDGISFANGTTYGECTNPCDYDTFMSMKFGVGYVEWKSIDVDSLKTGFNSLGNFKAWDIPYDWNPKGSNYTKDQTWNVTTYCAYFVTRTSGTHTVYKFKKLFAQDTYGPEDEYSSFSFQVYKAPGQSAVEVCIPFIDNIHDAWFRFNWVLNKAKPKGTRYNYNVIAAIARKMYKDDGQNENGVLKVIARFQNSIDDFYVNDNLNPNVGGSQNPHFDKPNGLDESIVTLYKVFEDQQAQISDKLGINAIREAYSPNPNDGYKLQMQTLAQSRNATEYMSRMIMSVLTNFGKHTLTIVQTMVESKGKYYTAIEKAIGFTNIEQIRALKKMPMHKYGMFVESFNTDLDKQQQRQEAQDAWMKGEIPYHVYLLVKSIDNYKKSAQILAYEKAKELKRKQEELAQMHEQKMAEIQAKAAADIEVINAKADGEIRRQDRVNEGLIKVAEMNNETDYRIKEMSLNSEPLKADVRANAKIRTDEAAHRIAKGEPAEEATTV